MATRATTKTVSRPARIGTPRRQRLRIITDPVQSAQVAGLRHVCPDGPGIRRRRSGTGFTFIGPDGARIRDPDELRRLRALALPPAWRDVWICPRPDGHLQAIGRDSRGRKQYRYHPRWREVRDETKYNRMLLFGELLPRIRQRVEQDLVLPGLPRQKILATVVRLLETTLIRVGNEEYARHNHSFGLTTLLNQHVHVNGQTIEFSFRGKSGKRHAIKLHDRRLARIVGRCRDLPGHELFQYLDPSGQRQSIDSADVNAYLREISGEDFTAKDFRTLAGTVLAALALRDLPAGQSATKMKKNVLRAIERVAGRLGNTPAICRKCYVHPAVITSYLDGSLGHGLRGGGPAPKTEVIEVAAEAAVVVSAVQGTALSVDEVAVLSFLRLRLTQEAAPGSAASSRAPAGHERGR